jgi:hypothetical protein
MNKLQFGFKPGETVYSPQYFGTTPLIINQIFPDFYKIIYLENDYYHYDYIQDSDLISAEIFNSPLYQSLIEIDTPLKKDVVKNID